MHRLSFVATVLRVRAWLVLLSALVWTMAALPAAYAGVLDTVTEWLADGATAAKDCVEASRRAADSADAFGSGDPAALAEAAKLEDDAIALHTAGNYAEAEPLYCRSLALREKTLGPDHLDVATSLSNLAILRYHKKNLAGAEPLYLRVLEIEEKALGPDHLDVAKSLLNLAILLHDKGDLAGAEPLYRRVLAIREGALPPDHPDVAASLNDLAILLKRKGDLAAAELFNHRAMAIAEKVFGPDHPQFLAVLNNQANLLAEKGDLVGAEVLYRRALEAQERALGPDHLDVAASLNNLAILLHSNGRLILAEQLLRRALAIREQALGPEHPLVAESLSALAGVLNALGGPGDGLDIARRAARAGHPRRGAYFYLLDTSGAERPAVVAESFSVLQQSTTSDAGAAMRSLAARASAVDAALAATVRREQDLAAELTQLGNAIVAEISKEPAVRSEAKEDAIRQRTVDVTAEITKIREGLAREFPGYVELSRPADLSLPDAQSLLAGDEALAVIDIAKKGEGFDYVWAVTRDVAVWKRIDAGEGEIAEKITRLRAGLDPDESSPQAADAGLAHELYRKLLGPVDSVISGKKHLIFVLNGAISSLPPQVLVKEEPSGKDLRKAAWLIRDHAITVLPTVSSLKLLRNQVGAAKAPKPFIGFGDPVFDAAKKGKARMAARAYSSFFRGGTTDLEGLREALVRLPGTARELRAVAASLNASESDVILREGASEAAVKEAKLADYNIVYFATHGLVAGEVAEFDEDAAEPALALTLPEKGSDLDDGLLTASEVALLKLNADWVVLSACNTAAEGKPGAGALSGLARAFFYAGARSMLVSHWVVDDEATAKLMSLTFAYAAANPARQAEALREAMLSVMHDPDHSEWADPSYWAPFVLVGEAR